MRLQCFNVQMDFWLCLASFQVSGQNTETLLDAPLNTGRPFLCRCSKLSACSLFRGFGYWLGRRILMRIRLSAKVISGTRRTRRPSAERNAQLGWFDSSILDTENKSQLQSGLKFQFYASHRVIQIRHFIQRRSAFGLSLVFAKGKSCGTHGKRLMIWLSWCAIRRTLKGQIATPVIVPGNEALLERLGSRIKSAKYPMFLGMKAC